MGKKYLLVLLLILCSGLVFADSKKLEQVGSFLFRANVSDVFANETHSWRQLDRLARTLIAWDLPEGSIHVYGYTARSPSVPYPTALAYNRAVFIINELVKRGVPRELFAVPVGYGNSTIFGDNAAVNRRATVNIIEEPAAAASSGAPQTERAQTPIAPPPRAVETAPEAGRDSESDSAAAARLAEENRRAEQLAQRLEAANREAAARDAANRDNANRAAAANERNRANDEDDDYALDDFSAGRGGSSFWTGAFLGLGPEVNANTRTAFSVGGFVIGGFEILDRFAFGFRAYYSHNLESIATFEPAILLRYMPFSGFFSGVFAEVNVGSAGYYEYGRAYPAPLGAIGFGWHYVIKRFYVEPYVRLGHPFTWGGGLSGGIRF